MLINKIFTIYLYCSNFIISYYIQVTNFSESCNSRGDKAIRSTNNGLDMNGNQVWTNKYVWIVHLIISTKYFFSDEKCLTNFCIWVFMNSSLYTNTEHQFKMDGEQNSVFLFTVHKSVQESQSSTTAFWV